MDFEELQVDADRDLKIKLQCERLVDQSSSRALAITIKDIRAEKKWITTDADATSVIWEFTSANTWWKSYECEDDLQPFCAQTSQLLLLLMRLQLEISTFLLWTVKKKEKNTHRMLKIHHISLDLLEREAISNLSPCLRWILLHQH